MFPGAALLRRLGPLRLGLPQLPARLAEAAWMSLTFRLGQGFSGEVVPGHGVTYRYIEVDEVVSMYTYGYLYHVIYMYIYIFIEYIHVIYIYVIFICFYKYIYIHTC